MLLPGILIKSNSTFSDERAIQILLAGKAVSGGGSSATRRYSLLTQNKGVNWVTPLFMLLNWDYWDWDYSRGVFWVAVVSTADLFLAVFAVVAADSAFVVAVLLFAAVAVDLDAGRYAAVVFAAAAWVAAVVNSPACYPVAVAVACSRLSVLFFAVVFFYLPSQGFLG